MRPVAALRRRLREFNPVMIRDLRQSLRGRLFRSAFLLTLAGATVIAAGMMAALDVREMNDAGSRLFLGLLVGYTIATFLVCPVLANRSMAAEREQAQLDALTLTGLTPARIVAGKFRSSVVLNLLLLAGFLPAFATAFSLYGIELAFALTLLALTTLAALVLNLVGIWVACLARRPLAGNLLLGLLLIGLGGSCAIWLGMSFASSWDLTMISGRTTATFMLRLGMIALLLAGTGCWFSSLAAWLLTHDATPEVGRVRVTAAALVLAPTLIAALLLWIGPEDNPALAGAFLSLLATAVLLPNLCEADALPARVALDLRRGRRRGSLTLLPGGGGASLLWLILLAATTSLPILAAGGPASAQHLRPLLAILVLCLAAGTIVPALAGRARTPRTRWVVGAYLFLPALAILHLILGLFVPGEGWSDGYLSLNPFFLVPMAADGKPHAPGLILWSLMAAVGMAAALRRIARAQNAVASLRRSRRAQSP